MTVTFSYLNTALGNLGPIILLATSVFVVVGGVVVGLTVFSLPKGEARIGQLLSISALFALLGTAVGFFAGNSRTPVIGDVLPAILTFMTVAMGFLINRNSDSHPSHPIWRQAMPAALATLLVATLFSVLLGSLMRRDAEYWEMARKLHFEQQQKIYVELCSQLIKVDLGLVSNADGQVKLADNSRLKGQEIIPLLPGLLKAYTCPSPEEARAEVRPTK